VAARRAAEELAVTGEEGAPASEPGTEVLVADAAQGGPPDAWWSLALAPHCASEAEAAVAEAAPDADAGARADALAAARLEAVKARLLVELSQLGFDALSEEDASARVRIASTALDDDEDNVGHENGDELATQLDSVLVLLRLPAEPASAAAAEAPAASAHAPEAVNAPAGAQLTPAAADEAAADEAAVGVGLLGLADEQLALALGRANDLAAEGCTTLTHASGERWASAVVTFAADGVVFADSHRRSVRMAEGCHRRRRRLGRRGER
jgi:hypothetical protein